MTQTWQSMKLIHVFLIMLDVRGSDHNNLSEYLQQILFGQIFSLSGLNTLCKDQEVTGLIPTGSGNILL